MHCTCLPCQIFLHKLSSTSSSFSASPLLKCSSACLRNLRNTMAGKRSGYAHTQSTWRNKISTMALFRKSWLGLAVEEALILWSRHSTSSLSFGTLFVMKVSVNQSTLSNVCYLNTSKFYMTKLNKMCVAKSKLSRTIATKSCRMASQGKIEAVFAGAFGEFLFICKCSLFWFGPAKMPKIMPLIIFLCMSSD